MSSKLLIGTLAGAAVIAAAAGLGYAVAKRQPPVDQVPAAVARQEARTAPAAEVLPSSPPLTEEAAVELRHDPPARPRPSEPQKSAPVAAPAEPSVSVAVPVASPPA